MQLRCAVCGDVQPVTVPDEADEDLRTRSIRRAFRADHVDRCGGPVTLDLQAAGTVDATLTDEATAWMRSAPPGVTLGADGFFSTLITRDGVSHAVRVCEACWEPIPRYVDFPFGLASPEDEGTNAKVRLSTVDGKAGIEHCRRALCLPCYLAAFARRYPHADPPALNADVVGDGAPVPPPVPSDEVFIGEPRTA